MDGPLPGDEAALVDLHASMLDRLGAGHPLPDVLEGIALGIEAMLPDNRCVVLLLDAAGGVLHCGASPNVTPTWRAWIDDLAVGPLQGSCGSAVHFRRQVIVCDVGDDPRYVGEFRDAALADGVRGSWSTPIVSGSGRIVGTFAVYSPRPERPTARHLWLVDRCRNLAAIAIDHVRLYDELAVSEERFRRAFDANVVGMALVDPDLCLQRVNRAFSDVVAAAQHELPGRALLDFVSAADRPALCAALRGIGGGAGDGARVEGRWIRSGGDGFPASVSISVLSRTAGAADGFCVHVVDETSARAVEAERRARREAEVSRRTAEAASLAKSWFLSGLAHEIHTPMSVILGFTELLETLELTGERRESAQQRISAAARHVISLVDDVLDIAKIESGSLPLQDEIVVLPELVGEVVALVEPLATQRGISVAVNLPDPGLAALADRRRVRQVLLNVVSNAIKYNRLGGKVHIGAIEHPATVGVGIADEGPGFARHPQQRIFAPFDRLGAERTRVQGSGLGLPLSRSLVEAMGGTLRLTDGPTSGAVVEIELPRS